MRDGRQPLARRIGRNSSWSTLAYVVDSLLVFVYTLLLARALGPAGFGLFSAAWGAALALFLLVDMGTSLLVIRETAAGTLLRSEYGIMAKTRGIAAILLALTLGVSARAIHPDSQLPLVMGLLAIGEGLGSLTSLSISLLRGRSRFGAVLAITTAEKVIIIASLLLLAAWAGKGMTPLLASVGLVAGRVVGLIAATLISWSETARLTGTAEALGWVEPYRKARSLGSFLIVERGTAYVIPLLVVWTSGAQAAGIFLAALKIILVPISLLSALALGLYPIFSELAAEKRSQVALLFCLALKVGLVVAAAAVILIECAPDLLVRVIFGASYAPRSGPTLSLLAPMVALGAIWQLSLYLLCASGREKQALAATLVSSVASLILISILGFRYGASGCAAGLVAGSVIGLISYWPRLRELGFDGNATRLLAPPAIGIMAGLILCRLLVERLGFAGLLASITFVLTVVPFAALRFGYVTTREKNQLGELIRSSA